MHSPYALTHGNRTDEAQEVATRVGLGPSFLLPSLEDPELRDAAAALLDRLFFVAPFDLLPVESRVRLLAGA